MDDILLVSNDIGILHETKRFSDKKIEMKDLGDASFVLGIQIHRDRSRGILRLSQKSYIERILERYGMKDCKPGDTPVAKGDKFSLAQCPKHQSEIKVMKQISYASVVGSLMYAQVCTRLDLAYIVGMLGRYLSNPGMDHWKAVKRVMRYLQRTKGYMLTYRKSDQLEIIGILILTLRDAKTVADPRQAIFFCCRRAISWKGVPSRHSLLLPPWQQNS